MTTIDLRPQSAPGVLSLTLLIVVAVGFLELYELNPHCTQVISFGVAVFDSEVHPEDNGWGDGPPLVFAAGVGWLLRGLLGLLVLAALLGPAIIVGACRAQLLTTSRARRLLLVMPPIALLAAFFPRAIIGERFESLLLHSALFGVALLGLSLLTVFRIDRWHDNRRRELQELTEQWPTRL
ncbi:MAG TPA: hypothetical protein VGF45_21080 [Polyangia bacterium]